MNEKKERILEKILKPIRINPVSLVGSALVGTYWFLTKDSSNPFLEAMRYPSIGTGFMLITYYPFSVGCYLRDRRVLRRHGFDERYGKLRMEQYCSRQALYVASVENGFRDEVKNLINKTPCQMSFLPHL